MASLAARLQSEPGQANMGSRRRKHGEFSRCGPTWGGARLGAMHDQSQHRRQS
jgi:hypothetical protein